MTLALQELHISEKEYLDGEEVSPIKHEYVAGRVYAMAGGSANHQSVSVNFLRESGSQLKGKRCRPFNSDFKIRIPLRDEAAHYYPDGMIVCGPISGKALFTESPTVILEVLSPSTRRDDEIQKFRDYVTIPSLKVYLLAESDEARVTVYRRDGKTFRQETLLGIEAVLELPEVEVSIPLAELYRDVELD